MLTRLSFIQALPFYVPTITLPSISSSRMSSPKVAQKRKAEDLVQDPSKKTKNTSITNFFSQPKPAAKPAASAPSSSQPSSTPNGTNESADAPASTASSLPAEPAVPLAVKRFDKEAWIAKMSPEQKELLKLEIETLHESWLPYLADEITSQSFLGLKRFLKAEAEKGIKIYPPSADVYSW